MVKTETLGIFWMLRPHNDFFLPRGRRHDRSSPSPQLRASKGRAFFRQRRRHLAATRHQHVRSLHRKGRWRRPSAEAACRLQSALEMVYPGDQQKMRLQKIAAYCSRSKKTNQIHSLRSSNFYSTKMAGGAVITWHRGASSC